VAGESVELARTTPEASDLQRLLAQMETAGVDVVALEVSSHALALRRVAGVCFEVVAFTNLSQDHLDFHGSMDAYLASKARLFRDHLGPGAIAVVNVDDPAGEKIVAVARDAGAEILRISRDPRASADLRLVASEVGFEGTRASFEDTKGRLDLEMPLLGDFNLENLAVAVGIARALDLEDEAIVRGVSLCPQVPGRMERVGGDPVGGPAVLVDYAHTPDAVEKLLRAVRPLCRGRLIAVFGCGGDRDRAKRPLMAEAVAHHADLAVATSDNPRTEDPLTILRDVEAGLARLQRTEPETLFDATGRYAVVVDRRDAIDLAIAGANPNDTIVLAGKGHEDYQIVGREKLPFDDRIEAGRALAAREGR
jgi:UDP-N-acetylmuramoyl-L-alanyl-D-glutamate--2,6-diaminopimelate ligase